MATWFFLIDNDGADPISGLFETPGGAALTEGSFFDLSSSAGGLAYRFEIGYRGDSAGGVFSSPTGNDLVLRAVAIPEPTSLALLLAFVGVVVFARARLRRLVVARSPDRATAMTEGLPAHI